MTPILPLLKLLLVQQDGLGGSLVTCSGGPCDLWKPHGPCLRPWLPHSVPLEAKKCLQTLPQHPPHPSIHPTPLFPPSPSSLSTFSPPSSPPTHFGNSGTVWPPTCHRHPPVPHRSSVGSGAVIWHLLLLSKALRAGLPSSEPWKPCHF